MAGNGNSGGFQPNAPQNNPANVSGTGGNGQSGDYKGFAYGQNKMINESRVAGNQAVSAIKASTPSADTQYGGMNFPELGTLLDPSTNPEPVSTGVDFGRGAGSDVLPKQFQNNTRPDENAQIVKDYLPDLALAAQSPNAPDSYKRFVNYIAGQ